MSEKCISEKSIESIINTVEGIKNGFETVKAGDYEVAINKNNGSTRIEFCRVEEYSTGFSRREFNKGTSYSSIYTTLERMAFEATYDGVTVSKRSV